MVRFLLPIVFSLLSFFATAQCVTNVNFNTWQQAGQPGNGNWSVQNGGTQIYQSVNGAPTFFISPFDLMNVHVSGNFRSTDTDDDWMGFVFSFLNPMGATDSFDCWLYDWKQENQGSSPRGMALSRAYGVIPGSAYGTTFNAHQNTPEFTVIDNTFGGPGWNRNQNHFFDLYLTYTRAIIYVDGNLIFDHSDCFKPGRFGFYNLSQRDCYYSNFQYELYIDFWYPSQVCRGDAAPFNFINPCVTSLGQYQSLTWNFGDGTAPVVISNPTLANVNVTHTYAAAGVYNATLTVVDNNGCSSTATHAVDVRNPIVLTPTLNQPPCNGGFNGSISVSATGGFGNYSFLWNGNANSGPTYAGIPAGTYTVTATDGVCNTSAQYTLNQPTALSATTSHVDANCGLNNGSATIVVSGGTPPYQGVSWAGVPGATRTGLAPGMYIADFRDANNCSAALQYRETIGSLPCGITSSVSKVNVSCFGYNNGSATLTISGATPGGTITWTPGGQTGATASNLVAGTYTYTYTNPGNPAQNFSGSVTITQPPIAMAAQLTTIGITCSGANNGQALASVTSGGVTPYTYSWSGGLPNSPSANNLGPGPISVTVTDSRGCTATASGTISGVPSLTATITTTIDSCFHSGKGKAVASVSGGSPPYSFAWSNFDTDSASLNLIAGSYTVTITDNNGCSITRTATITGPNALTNSFVKQNVACFGNTTGSFTNTTAGGTPGYTFNWSPNTVSGQSPTGLAAGIYFFTITDAYGCVIFGGDTIREPASALTVTTSHTDVTCFGANNGTVTVTVGGGTAPYNFQGFPVPPGTTTIPGLPDTTVAGNIVDANGCSVPVSETITEPTAVNINETHTNILCSGASTGSIDITVSGGTAGYTYLWSDGATTEDRTNLPDGCYTVTATDANGCTASASICLTEPAVLTITETHTDVLCNGASTGTITTTPAGGVSPYTFLWNDGNTNQNRTGLAASTYSVTVTDLNLCTASVSATLTQPTALSVTTSHTDVTCYGANNGTLTITIGGGTAPYNYGGFPVPAGTTTIPNLPDSTYSGNIADANGCTVPVSETITEPGPQSLTLTPTNVSCNGGIDGAITALFVNATGTVTYDWTPGGVLPATRTGLSAGAYSVTATDANNCTVTNSTTLTEPAPLPLNVTVADALCFGSNGSATANHSGTAPFNYVWSNGAGNTQTITPPAGTYDVTASDANQCNETATFTINQPAQIQVSEVHTNLFCFGDANGTITLTATSGAGPNFTYIWSPNVSTTNTATGLTAGTYLVTVTDQNNCPEDTSITITQPAQLVTDSIQLRNVTCFGQGNGSITIFTSGGTPGYRYTWNPNVSNTNTATNLTPGAYVVTVSDFNSCSLVENLNITEPATALSLTPAQTDLTCFGVNTGIAAANATGATPPYTYIWSPNAGTTDTVTGLAAGVYNVTVNDFNLCSATATYTITQPTQLVVTEVHTNNQCAGDNDAYIILTVSGATPGYTYQWNPNVSTNDSALNLVAGVYAYTVTDANSCTVNQSVTITAPLPLDLTLAATDVLCNGGSTGTVTATTTGGTSPFNFTLTPDGVNFQNSTTGQFTGLPVATYAVVVVDANTCADSGTITINQPLPLTGVTVSNDVSCFGYTDGQINITPSGGVPAYTFSVSGAGQNTTGLFTNLSTGFYNISITDANGCPFTDTTSIAEPPAVTLSVTPSVAEIDLGETLQLQSTTNQTGVVTYNWQPENGLSCVDCPNPTFTGNASTNFTITVTNDNGCSGTFNIAVTVVPNYTVFIPNAFTPDGNGANDFWEFFAKKNSIKQVSVLVFNRWGEKVFESNDINYAWDGTYKGEPAPAGVYTYTARFVWIDNHSDSNYKGSITLLR